MSAAPEPAPDPCLLLPASETPRASIRLALTEDVAPRRAPLATNDSERLLFRQLYDRLVELDCEGELRPGLAEAWTGPSGDRVWTLTLREEASFWDGTPLSAEGVIAGWRTTAELSTLPIDPGRAVALDERILRLELPEGADVSLLAHPDLAVTRRDPGQAWPQGTGAFRVDLRPGPVGGRLGAAAVSTSGDLEIQFDSGSDARDLLDAGTDLLSTRDPLAIDYASGLSDYHLAPLPWDRTYVLIAPRWPLEIVGTMIDDLARDAVRGEARPAAGPYWWDEIAGCEPLGASPTEVRPTPSASARLIYPRADHRAGELAERLVSVLASGAAVPPTSLLGPGAVALGLSPLDLAAALRAGQAAGFVLPLARRPLDPCRQMRLLSERAPWLAARPGPLPIVALVDTRATTIAGSEMTAVWIGGDGVPLLSPPRPLREASSP